MESENDLAQRYGCTFQYISQMETGHRGVRKGPFNKLVTIFAVPKEELLKMPKGFASDEMSALWEKFYALETGEKRELFEKLILLLEKASQEAVKSLSGLVEILEKNLKKE